MRKNFSTYMAEYKKIHRKYLLFYRAGKTDYPEAKRILKQLKYRAQKMSEIKSLTYTVSEDGSLIHLVEEDIRKAMAVILNYQKPL